MMQAVNDTLLYDVAPVAEKIFLEETNSNVNGRYTPVQYNRTGEIVNPSNIVSELDSNGVLSIRNIAQPSESVLGTSYNPPNDTTFSLWLNDGLVPNIFNSYDYPWMHPANFVESSIERMETSGEISDAFAKGMAKRGFPSVVRLTIRRS
jgi:hypothetical protein